MDREQKKIAFKAGYLHAMANIEKSAAGGAGKGAGTGAMAVATRGASKGSSKLEWAKALGGGLGHILNLAALGVIGIPAALGITGATVAKDFTGARKEDVDALEEAIIQDYYRRRIDKEKARRGELKNLVKLQTPPALNRQL